MSTSIEAGSAPTCVYNSAAVCSNFARPLLFTSPARPHTTVSQRIKQNNDAKSTSSGL